MIDRPKESFLIAQLSDLHFGDPRFDQDLMSGTIDEINKAAPDLVIISGDLTANGYKDQFEEAKASIEKINCPQIVTIAGMLIVTSGTASTWRTRGYTQPSYNLVRIRPERVDVTVKTPGVEGVREIFIRRPTGEIEAPKKSNRSSR